MNEDANMIDGGCGVDSKSVAEGSSTSSQPQGNVSNKSDSRSESYPSRESKGENEMESSVDIHQDDDEDDDTNDGEGIVIGKLTENLSPDSNLCWSCLIRLHGRADTGFLYTTHSHPLLNFAVCSVCVERTTAVESDVIDIELGDGPNEKENEATNVPTNSEEMNACSWCGLEDGELGDNDDCDEIPKSDLLMCDKCPRAFCVRCVILSLGGDRSAWETVRSGALESDKEWVCCACHPTPFLERLQGVHEKASSASPRSSTDCAVDNDCDNGDGGDSDGNDHDECIQQLLQELDYAEYSLEDATHRLDEIIIGQERVRIESELVDNGTSLDALESSVQAEIDRYVTRWQLHFDRFSDTIARLHDELESKDVGVVEAYYKCRAKKNGLAKSIDDDDDHVAPEWKIMADFANGECMQPCSF